MIPHSRKGIVGLSLTQTIGLVLAVGFIIMSIVVVAGLLNIFTGPPDQGTVNMFGRIVGAVDVMMHPSNTNDSCKILNGYIEPDFAVVGFNKQGESNADHKTGDPDDEDYGYVEEFCGVIDDDIYKPSSCLDTACLCLCNGGAGGVSGDDCKDPDDSQCRRVSREVRRFVTLDDDGDEIDLVIYGESCWGWDNDVIAGYVVKKKTGNVISVEPVMTQEEMNSTYRNIPECEDMVRDFRRGEERPEQPQQERDDVTPQIEAVRRGQQGSS